MYTKTMWQSVAKVGLVLCSLALNSCSNKMSATADAVAEEQKVLVQSSFYPGELNPEAEQKYMVTNASAVSGSDGGTIAPPPGSGGGGDTGSIPVPGGSTGSTAPGSTAPGGSTGSTTPPASGGGSTTTPTIPVVTVPPANPATPSTPSNPTTPSNPPASGGGAGSDGGTVAGGGTGGNGGADTGTITPGGSTGGTSGGTTGGGTVGSNPPSDPSSNPSNPSVPSTPGTPSTNPPSNPSGGTAGNTNPGTQPSTPSTGGSDGGTVAGGGPNGGSNGGDGGTVGGSTPPSTNPSNPGTTPGGTVGSNPPANPGTPSNPSTPSNPTTPTNPGTTPPTGPVAGTNPPANGGNDGGTVPGGNGGGNGGNDGGNVPVPPLVGDMDVRLNRVCSVMRSAMPYPTFVFFEDAQRPIMTFESLVDTKKNACVSITSYQPKQRTQIAALGLSAFADQAQRTESKLLRVIFENLDLSNVDLIPQKYLTKVSLGIQAAKSLFPTTWSKIYLNAMVCDDTTKDGSCVDEPTNRQLTVNATGVTLGKLPKLLDVYVWSGRTLTLAKNPKNCEMQYSPLVLDLEGNGFKLVGPESGMMFDLNDSGEPLMTGWVTGRDDAFLVRDLNGNGEIDSGAELFGSATRLKGGQRAANGFAALADIDSNGDGVVSSSDDEWSSLRLWNDSNFDGRAEPRELRTLDEMNIESIRVDYVDMMEVDAFGNQTRQRSTFRRTVKGVSTARMVIDVWFNTLSIH